MRGTRLRGPILLGVAVAASLGGCGSASPSDAASSATDGVAVGSPGPVTLAGADPDCGEPMAPTAHAQIYSSGEELPPTSGTDVFRSGWARTRLDLQVDTDGDGVRDEQLPRDVGTDPVALRRGDGVVTFVTSRPHSEAGSLLGLGDLDGDGRDEIAVTVEDVSAGYGGLVETRIVPGSTPAGEVDVSSVGTPVPGSLLATAGQVDGLAVDELLLTTFGPSLEAGAPTAVVTRSALAAAVGGGAVAPELRLPGSFLGWVDHHGTRLLVTGERLTGGAGVVVRVGGDGTCRAFTTVPEPLFASSAVGRPQLLVSSSGVDVVLLQNDRSGSDGYLWRVPGWDL